MSWVRSWLTNLAWYTDHLATAVLGMVLWKLVSPGSTPTLTPDKKDELRSPPTWSLQPQSPYIEGGVVCETQGRCVWKHHLNYGIMISGLFWYTNQCVCMLVSQSCPTLCDPRLLCPWNSPGGNTGVGCHSLLQGIFPIQGSNSVLLHCRQILYHLSHKGSPRVVHSPELFQKKLYRADSKVVVNTYPPRLLNLMCVTLVHLH